jgi:hypothetical protein
MFFPISLCALGVLQDSNILSQFFLSIISQQKCHLLAEDFSHPPPPGLYYIITFFSGCIGVWTQDLMLSGRPSTTWATPIPTLFALIFFGAVGEKVLIFAQACMDCDTLIYASHAVDRTGESDAQLPVEMGISWAFVQTWQNHNL